MKRYLLTRESKILGSTISIEGMKKDGAMFPMQIRIKETIIGEQLFFTAAINDITELNRLINDLETSNKALSDFAYIASHDLREPLRKISSFGSLLSKSLSEKLDADDKENLDYMIEGAKRMQQMVDDLLYYSRITTKAKTYSLIDLDELLKEIIKFELAQIIEDNNVKIIVENKLGTIKGEKTQIKQLFQNLIANGIKYRNKVIDPIIKIRSERSPLGIETQIEDNGIGIDEKYKDQVFEMFKRLHSKGEYEGSGIGLAVCKKIIELYNGEIKLNSEPGKGSTFIFRLPVKE
jgi:light-regulated signal transduction histidine kinase (bacteriophytochrome)